MQNNASIPVQGLTAETYRQLRILARARLRDGGREALLDTTALVHEAYLRIVGRVVGVAGGSSTQPDTGPGVSAQMQPGMQPDKRPEMRASFLAYASRTMRSVIVDFARKRQTERHGGDVFIVTLTGALGEKRPAAADEILRVHEALQELAQIDARLAQGVEMRYFGGLSEPEIAQALGISPRTVRRDWEKARMLLARALLA